MPPIEKSEILFIINAQAGAKNVDFILSSLRKFGNDLTYVITANLNELEIVMNKEFESYKVFVAVGGDGTASAVAKYLIHQPEKMLAILPIGSGNGFAKEMGFTFNVEKLITHSIRGETKYIDVLGVNGKSFINMAGIGLDAKIAHHFHASPRRGLMNYIASTFFSYFSFSSFQATINGSDLAIHGRFLMISIANTRQFGNNAHISPASKPNDGQFEIVLVKPIPFRSSLLFVLKLFNGSLKNSAYINYSSCQNSISITADCNLYHLDGDPLFADGKYEITITKNCLRVIDMLPVE